MAVSSGNGRLSWLLCSVVAAGFLAHGSVAFATPPQTDGNDLSVLRRIQAAAQKLDYSGTYTYQQGSFMQSSRLTHVVDATGEHERLEILDGVPTEFIRHNEEVQCLIPDKQLIVIEDRPTRERFPGVLLGSVEALGDRYRLSIKPEPQRVADRDCQAISLTPVDSERYGYLLCADVESGLLLKAKTVDANGEVLEQLAFTSLTVGVGVDRSKLKSKWSTKDWTVQRTKVTPIDLASMGWNVGEVSGFRKVTEVKRSMGERSDVKQLVMADGMAAISVFIEPATDSHPQASGSMSRGAIHVFGRRYGEYWLTVLGEAPPETVRKVADSIVHQPASK
ncbi:siderophore-interacting protein [Pigmentiphaga aceris]|uniref:Siderophore-interacting protein n=1 Tax=Pigmentiphaga aceris TaxID=1940612 RepID=A0A5C0AXQ9_9BURK|nr:siderophore-interacting protein [Pigmentiphaga aceris]